jgi:hypothetical protein
MSKSIVSTEFAKALARGLEGPALADACAYPSITSPEFIRRGMPRTYAVTMELLSGRRTRITIRCQGAVIGQRTTRFRHWFAHVWSSDWEYAIASLQRDIPDLRTLADLCDRVHQREPGAVTKFDRETAAWPTICREQASADLEKAIADGVYAARSESFRASMVLAEVTLRYLVSSQNAGREELFVKIWTQRRDYPCLHTPWAAPVDIIELTVPSVSSAGPWQNPWSSRGHPHS